jgi:crotonobetaine/carnitine-CoA ligase
MMAGEHDVASGRTLWSLAAQWAERRSDELVLVSLPSPGTPNGMETLTWQELAEHVWQLRRRLAAAGAREGQRVVICLPNSPLVVAIWLAVQSNGAIVHVVDPDAGKLAIERAIAITDPVLAIAGPGSAALVRDAIAVAGSDARLAVPADVGVAGVRSGLDLPAASADPPEAASDDIAALLPTSGTSGAPKFVALTHHSIVGGAERLARNSGFLTVDRHYLCSPFFHTNAQFYLCAPPFVTGGSMSVVPRFSAGAYFDAARWTGATVSSMVAPPMRMALHRALEKGGLVDPGGLRLIQYGMNLSAADWQAWDRLVPQIAMRQIYGQTESVSGVLGGAPWEADDRATIGRPFLGVDAVRLVGEGGITVPDGVPGEFWVKGTPGRTLMSGYYQNPDATAEALVAGEWLRTGDVMVRHPNGRFEFRGRRMHIIRRGGENLSTYALELDLQSCPLVSDVAVTAQEDATLDALVVAHVIPGAGFDEEAFRAWCREALGKRSEPDIVRLHTEFPRTGSGRVIARDLT